MSSVFGYDLQGREINFTNSKTLVSRPTETLASRCPPLPKNGKMRKRKKKKKKRIIFHVVFIFLGFIFFDIIFFKKTFVFLDFSIFSYFRFFSFFFFFDFSVFF